MGGTFEVPRRIYSAPDEFGQRQLLYAAGAHISWAEAVKVGLTDGDAVPAEEVPFMVPHNVYDDGPAGQRLVYREGTMISLADAVRLGLVAPPTDVAPEEPASDVPADGDPAGTSEVDPLVSPQIGKRVRTTKPPDPAT
jgi:hypothetical protein